MKKIVLAIVLSAVSVAVWAYTRIDAGEAAGYRFVSVERGDLESVVSSTGTLDAVTTVEVGTQVSGRIAEIYVDYNDTVEEGQLIARIDSTLLEIAVREAQANLERLEAQQRQAEREFERSTKLYEEQVLAEIDFNQARYDLEVANASVKSAAVNLDRARQDLAYATITAPISGTVVERGVDVGQTVAASFSAPQLFNIAGDLSRMRILASVDESDIGLIEEGQTARFTVQAYPEETFTGSVNQVRLDSSSQENVVNYTVVVDVDNDDGRLLPGMTATVEFLVESASDVMKVANAALRFRPTEEMMAALRERRQEGRPRPTEASADERSDAEGALPPGEDAGRSAPEDSALLWYVGDDGGLDAVPVRTGLSDGQSTEIEEGERLSGVIEPGMQVIAAVTGSSQSRSGDSSSSNPFQSQQQSSRPGPPGAGF